MDFTVFKPEDQPVIPPDPKPMPYLAPEISQMIFGNLDLKDLLRCQRVCSMWNMLIPGGDPILLDKLFLNAKVADYRDDGDADDYVNDLILDESSDATQFLDDGSVYMWSDTYPEVETPRIVVLLKAPLHHIAFKNHLPFLAYSIEVINADNGYIEDYDRLIGFEENTEFHPMIENPVLYMRHVNPNFTTHKEGHAYLDFTDLRGLGKQTKLPKDFDYKDGSWKDMMICRPAVRTIDISIRWPYPDARHAFTIEKEEGQGVTVGDFVNCFRQMLAHTRTDVMDFSQQMLLCCSNCGDHGDIDVDVTAWGD